ncbi:Disease resistance protein [Vitis vinifera]|uniref:Disease resistance protein n=1 Tax=Vitis vinifera TaxID=29760 RepID=A0A438GEQ0_VITVI|nr:Disease resistance protein [Vitis vinifera]
MVEIVVSVAAKVSEYLVDPAVRQLGHLFNYRANIEHLSLQVEKLRDARARLQHSVDEAIGNGHIIEDDVCKWMKRADEFTQNACKFLEDEKEARKSCFNGLCPNLKSRYQLSREARKKAGVAVQILEIANLRSRTRGVIPQGVTASVFQTPDYKEIQQQIAEKLGIPSPDDHKGCKLVLTSRNKQVLSNEMSTQKIFEFNICKKMKHGFLFKNTAGDSIENPELQPIAVDVAKECAGLPIAIVTVAKALKNKNVAIWKDALQQLESQTSTNITGMETKVYSSLKLSYEHLEGDE